MTGFDLTAPDRCPLIVLSVFSTACGHCRFERKAMRPVGRRFSWMTCVTLALGAALLHAGGQAAAPASKPKAPPAQTKAAPAPATPPIDGTWPREVKTSIGVVTLYQPQVDNWDGVQVEFRSAVSVKANAEAPPVYGVVWGTTHTNVDKDARLVRLYDRQFTKAVFPSAADKAGRLEAGARAGGPAGRQGDRSRPPGRDARGRGRGQAGRGGAGEERPAEDPVLRPAPRSSSTWTALRCTSP